MEILLGTIKALDAAEQKFDIDSIWPEDLQDLADDPARRVVQLAFFVTWVLFENSEDTGG